MNKIIKTTLLVLVVIAVLLIAAFVPAKKALKSISYEDYNSLEKPSVVYIGNSNEVLKVLKDLGINKKYSVLYLDYSKLDKKAKKEVKNEVIEVWKDKKLVSTYNFDRFLLKKDEKASSLKTVDINEYLNIKDSKGFNFMFIGRETCGYCVKFKEAIKELHKDYKVDINYIDTDTLDEAGFSKLTSTEEYLQNEQWGTPTSFVYYNGKQIDMINGYIDENALKEKLNTYGIELFLIDNEVL